MATVRQRELTPEDVALYLCHCGHAFTAAVTTRVECPSCGSRQAW